MHHLAAIDEDFGREGAGIVLARHGEGVGPCISNHDNLRRFPDGVVAEEVKLGLGFVEKIVEAYFR